MDIVILDGHTENPGDLSWSGFEELGQVTVYERTPKGDTREIIRRIGSAQAVITNKTPVTAEILSQQAVTSAAISSAESWVMCLCLSEWLMTSCPASERALTDSGYFVAQSPTTKKVALTL